MEVEKPQIDTTEKGVDVADKRSNNSSDVVAEKDLTTGSRYVPNEARDEDVVTLKTWVVVVVRTCISVLYRS
jgi:hypothetical protein